MEVVGVLLSTYNGEQYVFTQIDSVLKQTYEAVKLYIRDDGSSDHTLDIIRNIIAHNKANDIVLLEDVYGNIGFANSFSLLARVAINDGCDYFAFCDQDDKWFPQKIERAVKKISANSNRLRLYSSAYYITDSNLCNKKLYKQTYEIDRYTLAKVFMGGLFPGFSIVVNRGLMIKAFGEKELKLISHDKWISAVAVGMKAGIVYDSEPLVYYRRHESTASGTDQNIWQKTKWRIIKIFIGDFVLQTREMVQLYKMKYKNEIVEDNDKEFVLRFSETGIRGYFSRVFIPQRLRNKLSDEILLRIVLGIGK